MPNLGLSEDSSSEELGWAAVPRLPHRVVRTWAVTRKAD